MGTTTMDTPGINHVILTISDTARSRAFYGDLLGFDVRDVTDNPDHGFYFMVGGASIWIFPSREPIPNDRFSEFRVGLDHLAFTAPNEEALRSFADKLMAAGVETKGVETYFTGNLYVAFR